jgi:predicted ATP-dependent protease
VLHYRSLQIFALMAGGLWVLGALCAAAAAVFSSNQEALLRAGIVLLALSLVEGISAWLLALGDAVRTTRWLGIFGLLAVGGVFVAVIMLTVSTSALVPGYRAYVASLILAILLLPLSVLVYCDVVGGLPLRWTPAPTRESRPVAPAPEQQLLIGARELPTVTGARALRAVEELRRSAVWGSLPDEWRTDLLDRYPRMPGPMAGGVPLLIDHTQAEEAPTEDWLATRVVEKFQPEAASIIGRWLEDGSPNAHLLVVGPAGYGRTSLVASLARRARRGPVIVPALDRPDIDIQTALRDADGGVLVVSAVHLLPVNGVNSTWTRLVAALRTGARGQTLGESQAPLVSGQPQHPERSLSVSVRVAVVGTPVAIQTLARATNEFGRLFRYVAECNQVVDWTPHNEAVYAALADGVAQRYQLPPFEPGGVARLVEEGARRAGSLNQSHLLANLVVLHDLAAEAGQRARSRGAASTSLLDVEEILTRRRWEHGATIRRIQEAIWLDRVIVPTAGAAVGQINGLSVAVRDPDEGSFGSPLRISAIVGPGTEERLIDVEREADAADKNHIMGALTMIGYLIRRYGQKHPISVASRVRFEQSFANDGGNAVGGPSASAAELFALLSALAEAPIFSSLAVTGAVGQYGEIQVIGGVNHKIEGFWEICQKRWMAGERPLRPYGALIPAANAHDLMLRPEVAQSIAAGQFNLWAIGTVDEGLPILTGKPAAEIHRRVEQRLRSFHRVAVKGH